MKQRPLWITIWAGILLLVAIPSLGQQNLLRDCEIARDTARTRITIVSNSRVLMEEDLAAMSTSLRYERQRMRRLEQEIKKLKNQIRLAKEKSEADETKSSEGETKAAETETEPVGSETEPAKTETPAEELNQ